MYNMVRLYDIPGDYALSPKNIEDFVKWSSKPNEDDLESKVSWLKSNEKTYSYYGPYWLELAKDYYDYQDYNNCLAAVKKYEEIATRIYRDDLEYARILPLAIHSSREIDDENEYIKNAEKYCDLILKNTDEDEKENWILRYFCAQIYTDLYQKTEDNKYLKKAYEIARENTVELVDEQRLLNEKYMANIEKVKPSKNANNKEKKEVEKYNKMLKEERKIALPPISEALYVNADLLFALSNEMDLDDSEKTKIEEILHRKDEKIFLDDYVDSYFWFDKTDANYDANDIDISFDGKQISVPASTVSDQYKIVMTVNDSENMIEDWTVENVKRPKNYTDCSEFNVKFKSKTAKEYKYKEGDSIEINIYPIEEKEEKCICFKYNAVTKDNFLIPDEIVFEKGN